MIDSNQKSKMAYLRGQGFGYKRISKALGIPVATVKYHCRKNGFTCNQPKNEVSKTIEINEEIQNLRQAEMDYRLSKMMADYLLSQKIITKRIHKVTIKKLIEKYEPILGSLENEYGK